jgi:hypothetical protein
VWCRTPRLRCRRRTDPGTGNHVADDRLVDHGTRAHDHDRRRFDDHLGRADDDD